MIASSGSARPETGTGTTGGLNGPPVAGRLIAPNLDVHNSFLDALSEYHEEGLHLDLVSEELVDTTTFQAWADGLQLAGVRGEASCERDHVPHRVLWWVHNDQYIGRVRINLTLNESLLEFGGHIGYDVRPSARRQGHATALLGEALRVAHNLGVATALLTCAPENTASRRVIERNGGSLRDVSSAGRLRYWCLTR